LKPFDQKWQAAIKRFSFLGVSAKDNSKHWAMRRLSQLLVLALLSASSSYTNFSNRKLGAKASSWKHLATREALIKPLWKGFSWIRLQWTRGDQKFPQVQGNIMLSWPRCESKARWKVPIKRRQEKKSEIWAWGKDDLGFGSGRRLRWIAGRENRCWTDLIWRRWRLQSISE
jgi:hypothetical protein